MGARSKCLQLQHQLEYVQRRRQRAFPVKEDSAPVGDADPSRRHRSDRLKFYAFISLRTCQFHSSVCFKSPAVPAAQRQLPVAFQLFICLVQSKELTTFQVFLLFALFGWLSSQLVLLFLSLLVAQLISRCMWQLSSLFSVCC